MRTRYRTPAAADLARQPACSACERRTCSLTMRRSAISAPPRRSGATASALPRALAGAGRIPLNTDAVPVTRYKVAITARRIEQMVVRASDNPPHQSIRHGLRVKVRAECLDIVGREQPSRPESDSLLEMNGVVVPGLAG